MISLSCDCSIPHCQDKTSVHWANTLISAFACSKSLLNRPTILKYTTYGYVSLKMLVNDPKMRAKDLFTVQWEPSFGWGKKSVRQDHDWQIGTAHVCWILGSHDKKLATCYRRTQEWKTSILCWLQSLSGGMISASFWKVNIIRADILGIYLNIMLPELFNGPISSAQKRINFLIKD